jgi:hypothetical protein
MSATESGHVQLRHLTTQLAQHSPPSFSLINELLAFLTTHHIHNPKLVSKYGRIAIVHYRGKMGDKGKQGAVCRSSSGEVAYCDLTVCRCLHRLRSVGHVRARVHRRIGRASGRDRRGQQQQQRRRGGAAQLSLQPLAHA